MGAPVLTKLAHNQPHHCTNNLTIVTEGIGKMPCPIRLCRKSRFVGTSNLTIVDNLHCDTENLTHALMKSHLPGNLTSPLRTMDLTLNTTNRTFETLCI
jgi:hypothetical protein